MFFSPIPGIPARFLIFFLWSSIALRADPTEPYAVLVTAAVQESPATITLNWEQDPDPNASPAYTVYRKDVNAGDWGTGIPLGSVLTYTDSNVSVGGAYEYQIVKTTSLGYSGYGYIYAGIRAETVPDHRGKLILVVDETFTTSLAAELARLERDLAGDGWTVIRHDVVRDDESIPSAELDNLGFGSAANQANAAAVRDLIIADHTADPANVKAVLLFGRVPVFRAGNNDVDGHLARPMPADGFYGEMDGAWTTATNVLPSDVDLQVGRVDLSRMTGKAVWNGPNTFPSELELLRRYLNKDHNFRHGVIDVERRGIVGEGFGSRGGEAFAASGWRNFSPFFGSENITRAAVNTTPGSWQETVCDFARSGTTYLWAEGDGAGSPSGMGSLGTHGQYNQVWTRDLVGIDENSGRTPDIKAVFTLLFGSWFGEWDRTDDLMRGVLASRTMGLTASWSGIPHHYYHHMALGETVGYGMRLSQNNDTLYKNQVQLSTRTIHIALMGDPSLRMHVVKPPENLTASGTGTITLDWTASPDTALLGYNIYRSDSPAGPFSKLNTTPVTATTFPDTPAPGTHTYMLRAVKLETGGSGTYINMSQGVFVTADTNGAPAGNTAPLVDAGADQTAPLQSIVSLSGSMSDDGTASVVWSKAGGPGNVYFTDVNAAATQAEFSVTGTYTLRLTGNDGELVSSDEVTVTVTPPAGNQPPLVNAGPDQTITLPASAILSGTVTDETSTTNSWSMVNGPAGVTFSDPSNVNTTVVFPAEGIYTLRLTANDGALTSTDDIVISVQPPPPPEPGHGYEFTPDPNTVALYHFNNNYNDAGGNGYDLTPAGTVSLTTSSPAWMANPAGKAVRFTNYGDTLSVTIPDSAILPAAGAAVSLEARLFIRNLVTDNTNPNASILSLYQDYDAQLTIRDSKYHNPSGPEAYGASQSVAVTSTDWANAVSTNTWHDLLITLDANHIFTVYLDGIETGSVSAPANVNRPTAWTLTIGNFDGDLDELRVSNIVRTPFLPTVTFESWRGSHFTPAEIANPFVSGQNADPDKDEISNLLEYALGLDPRSASTNGILLTKESAGGKNYLHLEYERSTERPDVVCLPQVSADLQNWNSHEIVEISTTPNTPEKTETVRVRDAVSIDDATRRFIRLNAVKADPE